MSKKIKLDSNVESSAVNTDNVSKPVFNNITEDNATDNVEGITDVFKKSVKSVNISNVGSRASNTNMSIIVARRQKRK